MSKDQKTMIREELKSSLEWPKSFSDFIRKIRIQYPYTAIGIGSVFFAVGLCLGVVESFFLARTEAVTAVVARIDSKQTKKGGTVYRPVFEIERADGSKHSYSGSTWTSFKFHAEGEVVLGRYSRSSGRISSNVLIAYTFKIAMLLMVIGGMTVGGGKFFVWRRYTKRTTPS